MKILIATDTYKYQTSGAANLVIAQTDELRRLGNEVKVLALSNKRESFRDGDDYYIRSFQSIFYPDVRMSFVHRDPLLNELKEWKPDVLHIHSEGSAMRMGRSVIAATHTPIVMTSHTDYGQFVFGRFSTHFPFKLIAETWGRVAYRGASAVIAPSEKAIGFPHMKPSRNRITVIPNGIKLENYTKHPTSEQRKELFKKYGLNDNGKILIAISRLSKEKNLKELLKFFPSVLAAIPEAQFVIVGDGPSRKSLEAFTRKQGLTESVRFTGRIPPEEVYQYYDMGDVFVSASTFEVHSLSYLEAMANGLPLVCRDDACLKGVLENGVEGFVFHNESEFKESIIKILKDDKLKTAMSQRASSKALGFSDHKLAERLTELYRRVMDGTQQEMFFYQ